MTILDEIVSYKKKLLSSHYYQEKLISLKSYNNEHTPHLKKKH